MRLQVAATSLGDLFVAGSVAAAVAAWCWVRVGRLIASVFAVCFAGAVGLALLLKLVAGVFAPPLEMAGRIALSQGAPSGHAVCATTVYGCAAVLFLRLKRGLGSVAGLAYCLGVIGVVCVTRLTLRTHTVADVAAGVAIALGFAWLFDRALAVQFKPAAGQAPSGVVLLGLMIGVALLALVSGVRLSSTEFL